MTSNTVATSLFELLTYPNPTIEHVKPRSKTNSRSAKWHSPAKVVKWDEFEDFSVLEDAFGGHLLQEARRGGREFHVPNIYPDTDCNISNEKETRRLIEKWSQEIVTAALDPIQNTYHPVIWKQGKPPTEDELVDAPRRPKKQRIQPARKHSNAARAPRKVSLKRLDADSGSVDRTFRIPGQDSGSPPSRVEKFPKEYKPALKWNSKGVFEEKVVDNDGNWDLRKNNDNLAWPVRQAYTYCVQCMCRYGCIITCNEAFIFRVRPMEVKPKSSNQEELRRDLIHNGLLEYVSISWDSHFNGDLKNHRVWTINLALWFVHILAGKSYEANWTYRMLREETLAISQLLEAQSESLLPVSIEGEESSAQVEQRQMDEGSETDDARAENENESSSDSERSDGFPSRHARPSAKRKRDTGEDEKEYGQDPAFSFNLE